LIDITVGENVLQRLGIGRPQHAELFIIRVSVVM
jgi:hypothetical protein